ncbi:hypothetical protein GCM10022289_15160 [Pedobacter jeongneungensis]|uniref:Uncharacterized protein n=1 Tax=Pedobacter jeongneungensis TaxID=947309 RepID=A0ABP8BA01_9SPHI
MYGREPKRNFVFLSGCFDENPDKWKKQIKKYSLKGVMGYASAGDKDGFRKILDYLRSNIYTDRQAWQHDNSKR